MAGFLTVFCMVRALGYTVIVFDSQNDFDQDLKFPGSEVVSMKSWNASESASALPDVIMVLSAPLTTLSQIISYCQEHQIPSLINKPGVNQPWTFFMWPDEHCQISSILAAFSYFQILKPGILFSFSEDKSSLVSEIQQASQGKLSSFVPDWSESNITAMIGKFFKPSGIGEYFVEAAKDSCNFIENAFSSLKMNKKWNLVLYSEECAHRIKNNGSLALVYSGLERVTTDFEYSTKLLFQYYSSIKGKSLNNFQINSEFKKLEKPCKYFIINVKKDKKEVVGQINDGEVNLDSPVEYFGGSNQRTIVSLQPITFSAYTGSKNPPGFSDVLQNGKYQKGNYFAMSKINEDKSLLNNFELKIFDEVNCGVTVFDYNYSKSCFLNISDELGVAYIPSFYASTLIPLNSQWKEIGISTPMVSGIGGSIVLSSPTNYPHFSRMVSSLVYVVKLAGRFINIMGWNKVVVFYTDESFGKSVYELILEDSNNGVYQIINDEKYRKVDFTINPYELDKYKDNIKNAIDSGCNIFILSMSDPAPYFWMELLYDYGIRRGDITIIITTITGPDAIYFTNGNITKREELLYGSFSLYNAGWVGEYGLKVQEEVNKLYNYSWMSSFYIDATYSIAHSVDFLINQGKDYENPDVFMSAQRQVRFVGASGIVTLELLTNDRSLNFFNVYNIYKDQYTGKWIGQAVALIAPLSSVYYTVLNPFVWSGGKKPNDVKVMYKNCDIISDRVKVSNKSEFLQFVIILSVLGFTALITLIAARCRKITKINMLETKVDVKFSDYISILTVLIEPFQLMSIGPTASFNKFIEILSKIFSLNCVSIFKVRDVAYWSIFSAYLAFGYMWIIISIIESTFLLSLFHKYAINIVRFKNFMVPIMSDYLFLPITTSLLTILSCKYANGSDLFDSFFDYDCKFYCWETTHIALLVLTILFIIVYTPLAMYSKSVLQNKSESSNIKNNENYDTLKNIIILMIVAFQKFLNNIANLIFPFFYFALIFILFCYAMKNHIFNYDRSNLWNKVALIIVLWNTGVIILSNFLLLEDYFFICIQFLGITCIFLVGVKKHTKLPLSLIVMARGRTVVDMFRFQFGMQGYDKTIINPEKKTYDYSSTMRIDIF